MTDDEIYLFVNVGYELVNTLIFSRVERSYDVCSDIIQYRPDIVPAS